MVPPSDTYTCITHEGNRHYREPTHTKAQLLRRALGVMKMTVPRERGMTTHILEDSAVRTARLAICGMTCGACERHVRDALDSLRGVIHVSVNVAQARATVEHLPALVDEVALIEAVRAAGYDAEPVGETEFDVVASPEAPRPACGCCAASARSKPGIPVRTVQ